MPEFIDNFLYKFGYMKEEELVIRSYPKEEQKTLRAIHSDMLANRNNPLRLTQLSLDYRAVMRKSAHKARSTNPKIKDAINAVAAFGPAFGSFKPNAANSFSLFEGFPFAIYAYFARQHWAVKACVQVIRNEIENDGFELRGIKGVTKKRLREVYNQLKRLGIFKLRTNIAHHLKLYGNAYILPHKNLLGSTGAFELLAPSHLNYVVNIVSDEIIAYNYLVGTQTFQYPVDKILHCYDFSVDEYKPMGDPVLEAAVLAMEADLNADSYNNQIFAKSGFMGLILNVKTPESDPIGGEDEAFVEELQDRIDAQYSDLKAANSVLVTNNLESVHEVSQISKLDAAFQVLHTEAAKCVANCMGIPPEKIAVPRTPHLQYVPAVDEMVSEQFNKTLNALVNKVDDFLNERILKEFLNINDVKIVCADRYGGFTESAAKTIKALTECGPILTVNIALERIGRETLPPDDPRGEYILDNSVNRDMNSKPGPFKTAIPYDDPELEKIMHNSRPRRKFVSGIWSEEEEPVNVLKVKGRNMDFYFDL